MTRNGRLCPGCDSQCFTPQKHMATVATPPVDSLYAFKSAIQMLGWAPDQIKKARRGQLRAMHQHCSHCKPEPIENNVLSCWLGQDVAKCPILDDLSGCFERERQRCLPDGRKSYYADITDDEIFQVMGYVCTWHLLMSYVAAEKRDLPPPAFVDWNEGAFQDKSDRMFWSQVYDSMSNGMKNGGDDSAERTAGGE